jgi:acyl-CoA synthetase (AMP-forming)/AMP-acid ligase II
MYDDGPGKITTISWAEAARGIHRAAHLVASRVSPGDAAAALEGRPIVIAALAAAGAYSTLPSVCTSVVDFYVDTVTYVTTEVGILRAGFSVFPISTRNSPEAIAHLLKKTGTSHLLIGGEPMLQKLATASLELLRADGYPEIPSSHMPHFEDLYPHDDPDNEFRHYPPVKFDLDAPSLVLHSSGQSCISLSWGYAKTDFDIRVDCLPKADHVVP